MATWESSGQWMFSCYCPEKGKPNVSGFPEISPEELRLGYDTCSAKEGTGLYIHAVHQYVQQWRTRLQELKALNAWRTASMVRVKESYFGERKRSLHHYLLLDWEDSKHQALGSQALQPTAAVLPACPCKSQRLIWKRSSCGELCCCLQSSCPWGDVLPQLSPFRWDWGFCSSIRSLTSRSWNGRWPWTSGLPGPGSPAAANPSSTAPLAVAAPKAATEPSHPGASSASAAPTAGASAHSAASAPLHPHGIRAGSSAHRGGNERPESWSSSEPSSR
ncbi:nucleoporin NUP42-like isoform X2 [Lagopus muta]|uniref:nucleoporin NUP42-like isoform X2 n=1 Tax=Lagopus muta TaxID=64668 RepID=UPI00209D6FD1|nr:nucleoporin NUP42-like isoform X2 [Lagopus muta]